MEFKTLTSKEILLIKQGIAVLDKRLVSDINDQEVWDTVNDRWYEENLIKKRKTSWQEASMMCWDDWGFYNY